MKENVILKFMKYLMNNFCSKIKGNLQRQRTLTT